METITEEIFKRKCKKPYLMKMKNELSVFKVDLCFIHRYVPFLIEYYVKNAFKK
jgi:hypothetical protein